MQFLFQLCLTQQKRQRRAQVVEFLHFGLANLLFSRDVEPGELAVTDKQLLVRRTVLPPHLSRFFQPQRARFGAVHAEARIGFAELAFQAAQMVVMIVDGGSEGVDVGGVGRGRGCTKE